MEMKSEKNYLTKNKIRTTKALLGQWSDWATTECTKTCGKAVKTKQRKCRIEGHQNRLIRFKSRN